MRRCQHHPWLWPPQAESKTEILENAGESLGQKSGFSVATPGDSRGENRDACFAVELQHTSTSIPTISTSPTLRPTRPTRIRTDTSSPTAEYVVSNFPPTPAGRHWREVTQQRAVPDEWIGREPIFPVEAKVYTRLQ